MSRPLLVIASVLFLTADPGPAAQGSGGTGRISGVIVAADTGVPIKRVTVTLSGPARLTRSTTPATPDRDAGPGGVVGSGVFGIPSPPPPAGVSIRTTVGLQSPHNARPARITDETGRFEFTDLAPGRYTLMVSPQSRFVRPERVQPVDLTEGGVSTVAIKLERAGAITGRVLDESGEPLTRAQVWAIRKGDSMRRVSMTASTDDLGQFRIFDLPPGDYYVSGRFNNGSPHDSFEPSDGYAPTYFPGVPSVEGAQMVKVRSGQDAGNVDFSLVRVPLGRLTGTIRDASGQVLNRAAGTFISVYLASGREDGLGDSRGASFRSDGAFVFAGVPPGDYYLSASTYSNADTGPNRIREGAFLPITVDPGEQNVNLTLNRGATLSGHLVTEGTPRSSDGRGMISTAPRPSVQVRPVQGSTAAFSSPQPAAVADDGTFELSGVRGLVLLGAFGAPLLKSIVQGGDDLTTTPLVLTGTERLSDITITMTWDVGRLEGTVANERGDPATEAWVLVFPPDRSKWFEGSPHVYVTRTLASLPPLPPTASPQATASRRAPGAFVSRPLLPGRYLAVAVHGSSNMPPRDASSLEAFAKSAASVDVAVGVSTPVQLRLVNAPRQP